MSILVQIPENRNVNKNGNNVEKSQAIVDYTNMRLANWYENVWDEYGVNGSGVCSYNAETDQIIIDWVEDGERHQYTNTYWDDIVGGLEHNFNIWMEQPHYQN